MTAMGRNPCSPHLFSRLSASQLSLTFLILLLAGQACSSPVHNISIRGTLVTQPRADDVQEGFGAPEVVHTARNFTNLQSIVTECCTLAFSPTTFSDGSPAVKVIKTCTLHNVDSNGSSSNLCGSDDGPGVPINSTTTVSASGLSTSESTFVTQSTSVPIATIPITLSLTSLSASSLSSSSPPSSIAQSTSSTFLASPTSGPNPVSTVTSTSTFAASATADNNAASTSAKPSTALPKVIGAFAGTAVLLLIVGVIIAYLKQKKMNKKSVEEPIRWPDTS